MQKVKLPVRYWAYLYAVLIPLLVICFISIVSPLMVWAFIIWGLFVLYFGISIGQWVMTNKIQQKNKLNFLLPMILLELVKLLPYILASIGLGLLAAANDFSGMLGVIFIACIVVVSFIAIFFFVKNIIRYTKNNTTNLQQTV